MARALEKEGKYIYIYFIILHSFASKKQETH